MQLSSCSAATLAAIEANRAGKRVVFVSGNFNIIHPGHLRLLGFARELGDIFVVGVLPDGSAGAYAPAALRLASVQALSMVDHALELEDPLPVFLRALRPDFVIKGKEHEDGSNPEEEVLLETGGKLLFTSGNIALSANDLILNAYNDLHTIVKPLDFPTRHGFSPRSLVAPLERMRGMRVCVVGDVIVDEYITCDPLGMSQEDPTIVVSPVGTDRFLGGAGIVAAHAAGLGAEVSLFTVTGHDDAADFAAERLKSYNVRPFILIDPTRPTTLKQRYRCQNKTLLRVSHLRQHAIDRALMRGVYNTIQPVLDKADLLIFSDFNYGCLPPQLVNVLTAEAGTRGVLMAGDSQSSSQVGDVSRFRNTALLTPTEREARLALHDFESGLVVLADKLCKKASARNVVITLGEAGMLVYSAEGDRDRTTDRLPAMNTAPRDTAGAGDSFLTTASMLLASGSDIWKAAYLGSIAAALQVGRTGNTPLTHEELRRELLNESCTL